MKISNLLLPFLILLFILPINSAFESQKIYFIDLEYRGGELKLLNVNMITGFPTSSKDNSFPYLLEVISFNDETLNSEYFNIPNLVHIPPPIEGSDMIGIVELDNLNFSISVPHNEIGDLIKISKDGKELLSIDVSEFSKYCGDFKCQYTENYKNCPQDCSSGGEDYYCDKVSDGICDLDCDKGGDTDCPVTLSSESGLDSEKEKGKTNYLLIIIGLIILLSVIISTILIHTKNHHRRAIKETDTSKLKQYINSNLMKGYSKVQIKQALQRIGWKKEPIDKEFKNLKK